MKINLFFDVGSTLHHPTTGNWFITPNFFNILGTVELDIVLEALKESFFLLDERQIHNENEEFDMFCKFYLNVLKHMKYPNISTEIIQSLAYDNVFNDNKVVFYPEVKNKLKELSTKYDLYIISDAWPSTYRILKDNNLLQLFKKIYISSELGYKKSDKILFKIALEDISLESENYFIDDRIDLINISKDYGFIPILIDRENNQNTTHIKINNLNDLEKILDLIQK